MGSISLIQLPYDSGRFGERMGRGFIALLDSGLAEHLQSVGNEVDVASVRLSEGLHNEANALVDLQGLAVPLIRDAIERQARPIILSGNCGTAALSAMAALGSSQHWDHLVRCSCRLQYAGNIAVRIFGWYGPGNPDWPLLATISGALQQFSACA